MKLDGVMALFLMWDLDSPTNTRQSRVHQQREKTESCGATSVVRKSWGSSTEVVVGQTDVSGGEQGGDEGERPVSTRSQCRGGLLLKAVARVKQRGVKAGLRKPRQLSLRN